MDDRDYYWLSGCVLVLAICGLLNSRKINAVAVDVDWLKDHTVARETEARPS